MEMTKESFRNEVQQFRASFKEDAMGTADKSLVLERRGNVGVIVFDQFGEKANKLSTPNLLRLFDIFTEIEKDKSLGAIVIISRKPTIFIAGADIAEISKMSGGAGGDAANSLMKLQAIFTFLERLPIPSIAAINGACMGGGTELTLACDYRMVTDAPETRIALPEVKLGIIPGWGGTQRMPRLVGLEKGIDMVLTGRSVDGKAAKKMGLADRLVPKENLEEKAMAWAKELAEKRQKRKADPGDLKEKILSTGPAKWLFFDIAKRKLLEKTKGQYPAPLAALEVIRKTYGGNLDKGLRVEAEAFAKLIGTPECQNLIRVFYLTEKVKKDKGTEGGIAGKEIKHAGVLGAGVMGGGIAQLFAAKTIRVRLKDIRWDAITKGYQAAYKIFSKEVKKRKMKESDLDNAMARIEGTTTYSGFKHLDLVVEAVVEDLTIKKKVLQELEGHIGPDTIVASNTSSLSITQIAEGAKKPERVVGMHFFNPVDKMPLVEVIKGKLSDESAVATIFQLSKKLGKTPIVVKDSPGFVVNRILCPYLNEAVFLLSEGVPVARLDKVMEKFGMPMGPCTLLDEIGLDVGSKVSKVLYGAFGDRMKPPTLLDVIAADGRLGKKSGKGIFIYEDGGKKKTEDPTLMNKLGVKSGQPEISDEVIQKRLVYLMVNEAARCLDEKLVRDVADIDIGMIFGTGFAPFRGGLLRYADSIGAESIVGDLEIFSRKYGARFQPASYLQALAVGNKSFYGDAK